MGDVVAGRYVTLGVYEALRGLTRRWAGFKFS